MDAGNSARFRPGSGELQRHRRNHTGGARRHIEATRCFGLAFEPILSSELSAADVAVDSACATSMRPHPPVRFIR